MSTYISYTAAALLGLFLAGAVFGLGVWVGHGWLTARADRKLQREYLAWYEAQVEETKKS